MNQLSKSASYRDFVNAKNRYLEEALLNMRGSLAKFMSEYQDLVKQSITTLLYTYAANPEVFVDFVMLQKLLIDHAPISKTVVEIMKFRMFTYLLSVAAEAKAIQVATGKQEQVEIQLEKITKIASDDLIDNANLRASIAYYYDRLIRKVIDAVQIGVIMKEPVEKIIERVSDAMPKPTAQTRIKRLKRVQREAKKPSIIEGIFTDQQWEDLLKKYLPEFAVERGIEYLEEPMTTAEGDVIFYDWELEKAITEDFVKQVRAGQIEGAAKMGLDEFVWIAILDDRTCQKCCEWRDGLTTTEIEKELRGRHKNDDCRAITPPAHFNCRCDIVPVSREKLPDRPPGGREEFEDWLSKR